MSKEEQKGIGLGRIIGNPNDKERFQALPPEWHDEGHLTVEELRQGRELPKGVVGCKICNKSIHQVFVEHLQEHLK